MIWFLEGQASQRDILLGAREALPAHVRLIASHRGDRPEITGMADLALREPETSGERIEWVIRTALAQGVQVILAGRLGAAYEAERQAFEAAGLTLVTGGLSAQTFQWVDDKAVFTSRAEAAGLACIPAISVTNAEELAAAYQTCRASGEVCIKPVVGIYGQGFWRLREGLDPFRCFANPDSREVDFATYLQAYAAQSPREPLLVMPYLPGAECSVDMVCEAGKVVAYVGRRKSGVHQRFERDTPATRLALAAAEHFQCDGIVNVQTRDDGDGQPRLLEINPRYSGGIGYTRLAGVNLPGIFAARRLGLPEPRSEWVEGARVKPITIAVAAPE